MAEEDVAAEVRANLDRVRQRIAGACVEAGRDPAEVTLVAVAKGQPLARVEAALGHGQKVFGENYVQEAALRWAGLRDRHPGIRVDLVGALQSNKAATALPLFQLVQTLDRERLATALAKEAARLGRIVPVLIEVNLGREPQKAGVHPEKLEPFLAQVRALGGLEPRGLMAIPPADEPAGPHAARLVELARALGLAEVSVGMSGDYEDAIRAGATIVRVGTAIFGQRAPRRPAPPPG